jgi:AAA15 family ATPase/GTPase
MLIRYAFRNWLSFQEEARFSTIASNERQHNDRVARIDKFDLRVLPVAAIYGGNASGKTNFVKSLAFAKSMVVRGTQPDGPIPVSPFLLDPAALNEPCAVQFEMLVDDVIYDFSFTVTAKVVVEEKLVRVKSSSETVLYHRQDQKLVALHSALKKEDFYRFAFQGTRANQLYLTNAVSQNVTEFRPVYDWFKRNLVLIAPDFRVENFEDYLEEDQPLHGIISSTLAQLDTGIAQLDAEEIPLENLPLPDNLITIVNHVIKSGGIHRIHNRETNERFVFTAQPDGGIRVRKLVSNHKRSDGSSIKFDLNQESSGTQRVIDLLPAFVEASDSQCAKVFVIDELDRSMHTLLTRQLLEAYLGSCNAASRSQLIFTTHDVLLMDQELLRRDEMWVTERDTGGRSQLFSFAEYKELRNDTDIRKRYLQGRLGGVPRILLSGELAASAPVNDEV